MRREETKCKKPLASTQLLATVQPNPFEPSQPSGSVPLLLAWDQAVGSAVQGRCITNTSLTVHRPALVLSNAQSRSPTTCDSLTGKRSGSNPTMLTCKNRLCLTTGADMENVDCWPMATVPTYQSVGVRLRPITVVASSASDVIVSRPHSSEASHAQFGSAP
jgi:hypothetical protein